MSPLVIILMAKTQNILPLHQLELEGNLVEISEKLKKGKQKLVFADLWYKPIKIKKSTMPPGLAILIIVITWESEKYFPQKSNKYSTN